MNDTAHFTQSTQRMCAGNQPNLIAVMTNLQYEFSDYKFTVYRCAAKFVTLQKVFHTGKLPYKLVQAMLDRHGIRNAGTNFMVPPFQLTSLIRDIYFACQKLGHFKEIATFQLDTATSVLANFFWNIFDPQRRHSVSLLEIQVVFLLLCKQYTSEHLVAEFYNIICDPKSKYVSKLSFQYLLNILIKTITYIGEGNAYGAHNSQLIMEQCFGRCHNKLGLTECQFLCIWSTTQTRFLIYTNLIALIKRMEETEKLIHSNICAGCNSGKIIGIRFKCQSCKNISLCQKCFATGYAGNKHEAYHRMYEVFTEDLPPKKISHYFAKLCSTLFTLKNTEDTKGFCNPNETCTDNETELVTVATHRSSNASTVSAGTLAPIESVKPQVRDRCFAKQLNSLQPSLTALSTTTTNALDVTERLQSIINRLLQQNTKLEDQLKHVKTATNEEISQFLSAHQCFLIEIITEMRSFAQSSFTVSSYPTSSTPNNSASTKKTTILNSNSATDDNLTHSINGAEINRSYLEANKSDYSINDLSLWFNQVGMSMPTHTAKPLSIFTEAEASNDNPLNEIIDLDMRETEMTNFRLLLNKVKEIVEDSYSDNTELAEATQNLENVLDNIIQSEEGRRNST